MLISVFNEVLNKWEIKNIDDITLEITELEDKPTETQ